MLNGKDYKSGFLSNSELGFSKASALDLPQDQVQRPHQGAHMPTAASCGKAHGDFTSGLALRALVRVLALEFQNQPLLTHVDTSCGGASGVGVAMAQISASVKSCHRKNECKLSVGNILLGWCQWVIPKIVNAWPLRDSHCLIQTLGPA